MGNVSNIAWRTRHVNYHPLNKMESATDLSDLLGGNPVQAPAFAPMVTGGGDPFSAPISQPKVDYTPQLSILRYSVQGLLSTVALFLAAFVISLSVPRTLLLQYIPNTYTTGGVVSYTGAAVLAGAAVVISYILNMLFRSVF
jgi:hypothetical protein